DPVVTVRENFVACDVLSQLQRVMDDPRFLLTGECEPLSAGRRVRIYATPWSIASGFGVSHAFRPVLGNDAGGVQLGGSGDTADDRPTARARMGDRGLCERL